MQRGLLRPKLFFFIGGLFLIAWCARIVFLSWLVWQDITQAQTVLQAPDDLDPLTLVATVHNLREHSGALRLEAWPVLQPLRFAQSLPRIGPTLASLAPSLDLLADLSLAGDECLQTLAPVIDRPAGEPPLPILLTQTQAHATGLQVAAAAAQRAQADGAAIPLDAPQFLTDRLAKLDSVLPLAPPAIQALTAVPQLLGADQPRTYLLLIQNEDELRATGGFINSVGILRLAQGHFTFEIQNSYALDNFPAVAYPAPPEALRTYMGADLWLLRDGNWSPDFPTAANTVAGLYRLGQGETVAGVVAVDQTALKYLLQAIGPLALSDGSGTVSADTLDQFLQDHWQPEPGNLDPSVRAYTSGFMGGLGEALVSRLTDDPDTLDWRAVFAAGLQILSEKHALIFVTEPALTNLLSAQGWNGALVPGDQDYLYVVDSNVGFNKVNARLARSITYQIDLTNLSKPVADLTIDYQLTGSPDVPCRQINNDYGKQGYEALTQGCYWDYLRVYAPESATLLVGRPLPTPSDFLWNGQAAAGLVATAPGPADSLEFSQFLVVPSGQHQTVHLSYALPARVVQSNSESKSYCVAIQKQPGAQADSYTVRMVLPPDAKLVSVSATSTITASAETEFQFNLRTDQQLCARFN